MSIGLGGMLMVVAGLCAAAAAIAYSLAADEIRAWLPYLSRCLVRSAARRLPRDMRARYEEDWLAELVAWEDRPLSAFAKAAHIRWRANGIRGSLCGVAVKGDRLKRAFDLGFAIVLLAVLSPLMVATAIAIKLESRGPVFFRQHRAGRRNTSFGLIKFRSMYVPPEGRAAFDEADDGVMFKIRQDPRVTRVGGFIRRYSLDELPQLFNVLRGDMSLVGPRPLIFPETKMLDEDIEQLRSTVRPGITGTSQLASDSSDGHVTYQEMIGLDAEYVRSRSLLVDLRVLLRTVLGRRRSAGRPR